MLIALPTGKTIPCELPKLALVVLDWCITQVQHSTRHSTHPSPPTPSPPPYSQTQQRPLTTSHYLRLQVQANLDSALAVQQNSLSQSQQALQLINQETSVLVEQVLVQANITLAHAMAQANLIVQKQHQ